MTTLIKVGKWLATVLAVLVLTLYFARAFDARNMPELGPEHRIVFEHEFDAARETGTDWLAYLAIEDELQIELDQIIDKDARTGSQVDRYSAGSLTYPGNYSGNWNRSYEVSVPLPRGVAVLLHGLTDSPYSMLATAQALAGAGYNVVVPRMPGHGFAVSGLLQARHEDWTAAVRVAVRHASQQAASEQSLLIAGYSNGGLLAVDYALRCDDIDDLPCPDGLVLLSPGLAISPFAAVTNWHAAISWIPYFEKFKWAEILPEVDPFKFTSFPKRPAWEVHKISKRTHQALSQPDQAENLPPILTFQSVVDNTVSAPAITSSLYDHLPVNGSELVLYDINRESTLLQLVKGVEEEPVGRYRSAAPLGYDVTILKNRNPSSVAVDSWFLAAGEVEPVVEETTYSWPDDIYSLSHIALPFRIDDPVYGDGSVRSAEDRGIVLGALAPRGERDVLLLTPNYFLRARYNPFMAYQEYRLNRWLDEI
ncbi:MAG: alpha/beta fold hydrolase [Gammaproteobacteria bacterium]|nr:alpha/beta fold hydrolase [Gammaproteobacteria bacterium]MBT8110688.1 alpha/beta fold hydrolase [Gammaproteobacteria bacterium]NND47787.1 alpha/beta fold hydrolase [Woeseiaceae bacterium]NNL45387.1 alpha/beta fold hydrolase [Woeseiaceae bacterium]